MTYQDNRKKMITQIGEWLDWYGQNIRENARGNDLSGAIYAENNIRDLLNGVFDYHLENANYSVQNAAGVDLLDREKKICIQITITKGTDKIKTSLKKTYRALKEETGWKFQIMILSARDKEIEKLQKKEDLTNRELFFRPLEDILDFTWLRKEIGDLEIKKLRQVYSLCENMFSQKKKETVSEENLIEADVAPKNANQQYDDGFTRPLFLHPGNEKVTLEKLFICQEYSEEDESERRMGKRLQSSRGERKEENPEEAAYTDLEKRLIDFAEEREQKLLIIEGDAGTGKSTLVQYLNYLYAGKNLEDELKRKATRIFQGRELITVRLRDFTEDMRKSVRLNKSLFVALEEYLNTDISEINRSYVKKLYVLDGFDELCTSDSGIDAHQIIKDLLQQLPTYAGKLILTTRPDYIRKSEEEGLKQIKLKHYSPKQREQWIQTYIEACDPKFPDYLKKYIASLEEESIFDVPLNLYMLAAKKPEQEKLDNTWNLYHDILGRDIRDTMASRMTGDEGKIENPEHPEAEHWDTYYQICEEIAYGMYKEGNKKLWVNSEDIRNIIQSLRNTTIRQLKERKDIDRSEQEKMREEKEHFFEELEKHCHALCGFWKTDTQSGVFEFYHNDLRDFFLCEKVFREINRLYAEFHKWKKQNDKSVAERENARQEMLKDAAKQLAVLFQYARMEKKVLEFILERADLRIKKGEESDFSSIECDLSPEEKWVPAVSQILITDDRIYPENAEGNRIVTMATVVKCVWEIFANVNLPLLRDDECTALWEDVDLVNRKRILKYLFQEEADNLWLPAVDLKGIEFSYAYLEKADLRWANVSGSIFKGANLCEADLREAYLNTANLEGANLSFSRLQGVDIKQANFNQAKLNGVEAEIIREIRQAENFKWADLTGSNLQNWREELIPGSLYEFGSYWQGKSKEEGKSPILWRVLDVDSKKGRALLLADQILDCEPYHKEEKETNWEKCSLRTWLNGTKSVLGMDAASFMYQAFNEKERKRICTTVVTADKNINPAYDIPQGKTTRDKIFLLSGKEVVRYFEGASAKMDEDGWFYEMGGRQASATATEYARNKENGRLYVSEELGTSLWWLRSVGVSGLYAMNVCNGGDVLAPGHYVDYVKVGVRPALWISLKS